MMNLRSALLAVVAASSIAASANAASWVYVGSWYVGDGPVWTSNPAVLTGQETAALLWGGVAANYAISTIDSSVANINFSSFVDGWGDGQYLTTPVSQSYSLDSGNAGYNDPVGGPSYSAYVLDHSCFNRYNDITEVCQRGEPGLNYAFRAAVPEPASWALMITGFGMVGFAMRRRSRYATA